MKNYIVAIGYGENVQSVEEFHTVFETVMAESAEKAAIEIFNGLEEDEKVVFQVRPEDSLEYEYFQFLEEC